MDDCTIRIVTRSMTNSISAVMLAVATSWHRRAEAIDARRQIAYFRGRQKRGGDARDARAGRPLRAGMTAAGGAAARAHGRRCRLG